MGGKESTQIDNQYFEKIFDNNFISTNYTRSKQHNNKTKTHIHTTNNHTIKITSFKL